MRRFLVVLLGFVNALLTAVAAAIAGEIGAEWHNVTTMEGARGMLIVFIFMPLGFLVGFVVHVLVARARHAASFTAGLKRLGLAALISLSLVSVTLGFAWVTAEHPPTIDGRRLALEYEVRLPPRFPVRDSLEAREFRVAVVASSNDRFFTDLDFTRVATVDSFVVVPGRTVLRSRHPRSFSVTYGAWGENRPSQFVDLPLAPSPRRSDFTWSSWMALTKRTDLSVVPASEQAQVRYRVQFADSTGRD